MRTSSSFHPTRSLLACAVLSFAGLDILAHGVHDHSPGMMIAGLTFLLPSCVVGLFTLRWIWRGIRAFFA